MQIQQQCHGTGQTAQVRLMQAALHAKVAPPDWQLGGWE